MIKYKVNISELLKNRGFNSTKLQKTRIISKDAEQQIRHGNMVSIKSLDIICTILQCQPGDIIEWVNDPEDSTNAILARYNGNGYNGSR